MKNQEFNKMSEIKEEEEEEKGYVVRTYKSFDDMELKKDILKGIYGHGFEHPSAIQQKAIVPMAKGLDLIAQSQSGTGKTGTFVIGILQRIELNENCTQALILSPTRELASQTFTVVNNLGHHMKDLRVKLAIGGVRRNPRFFRLIEKSSTVKG